MRALELREMNTNEILHKLDAARHEMYNLRIAFNTNSLDDPNQIRRLRKDIARMLTVLRERELAEAIVEAEDTGSPAAVREPVAVKGPSPTESSESNESPVTEEADHAE